MASTAHKLEISDLNNRMTMENYIKARACKVETKSYSLILYDLQRGVTHSINYPLRP